VLKTFIVERGTVRTPLMEKVVAGVEGGGMYLTVRKEGGGIHLFKPRRGKHETTQEKRKRNDPQATV